LFRISSRLTSFVSTPCQHIHQRNQHNSRPDFLVKKQAVPCDGIQETQAKRLAFQVMNAGMEGEFFHFFSSLGSLKLTGKVYFTLQTLLRCFPGIQRGIDLIIRIASWFSSGLTLLTT